MVESNSVEKNDQLTPLVCFSKDGPSVGGTTFPNTDNDESAILENEERRTSPTTSSDENISIKTDKRYTLCLGVKRSDQAREKTLLQSYVHVSP